MSLERAHQGEARTATASVYAQTPRVIERVYRTVANTEHLQPNHLVGGLVLNTLIWDDGNLLVSVEGSLGDPRFGFNPQEAEEAIGNIRSRMVWERQVEETPEEIKALIDRTIDQIPEGPVPSEESWRSKADRWWDMKSRVEAMYREREDWQDQRKYFLTHGLPLQEKYRDLIQRGIQKLAST